MPLPRLRDMRRRGAPGADEKMSDFKENRYFEREQLAQI